MYAISLLDTESVLPYVHLVPFEARPVVYAKAVTNLVHCLGATLFGQPIGIAIAVEGSAEPGTRNALSAGSARLITLRVAPTYRRLGVGGALLRMLEATLADKGVRTISSNFSSPSTASLEGIDGLLNAAGWSPREVTMLQCRADHSLLSAPVIREQSRLPTGFEIVDWVDLSDDDRDDIRERQRVSPWYPDVLDPFHYEPELEVLNSLALKLNDRVVGWLITRRTSPLTMYYRCMFVREDLQKLGRSFSLLYEAVSRHAELVQSGPGYGEWSTPASLRAMCAFIKRRLEPFGTVVTEQYVSRKSLQPRHEADAVRPATKFQPTARTMLSNEECERAAARVLELRDAWVERDESIPIHTLGSRARDDAFDGRDNYLRSAHENNPLLEQHFNWLYQRLHEMLSEVMGSPVVQMDSWARPVFRVVSSARGAHLPVAPIHCDMEFTTLAPGVEREKRTLSFALLLSQCDSGAGLTIWDLEFSQTIGLDSEETARLLDETPSERYDLTPGMLLVHAAEVYHQTTPRLGREVGRERVTLEGHAVYSAGTWYVYG